MEEILSRFEALAGSRCQVEAWHHSRPIDALGGLTAEQLVNQERIEDLKDYLDHIGAGYACAGIPGPPAGWQRIHADGAISIA